MNDSLSLRNRINTTVRDIPRSGIRDFFDLVTTMKDVISLGIGEPDFDTPWHVRESTVFALERGATHYSSNLGYLDLRRALARYVQKTALDAARIIAISEHSVSFRWTHRESGETRITTVKGSEFLRRFLQHVLPRGYRRVRHYGYLSAAAKERYELLRSLLKAGAIVLILPEKTAV